MSDWFPALYREMAVVPRWGIFRRIKEQSVGEHMYFVAVYAKCIADLIEWDGDRALLLEAALIHDLFEGRSGDIPFPFKRQVVSGDTYDSAENDYMATHFPGHVRAASQLGMGSDIALIIKLADSFESCMYMANEQMLGNRYAGSFGQPGSPSLDVYTALQKHWARLIEVVGVRDPASKWNQIVHALNLATFQLPPILMGKDVT